LSREPIPNALRDDTGARNIRGLPQQRQVEAHDRSSFLAVAGAMRRVLVVARAEA
jgi:hypothetical protein